MSDKEESPLKPVGADDRPASRPAAREGGLSATQTKSTAQNGVGGSGEDEEKPKDSKLKVFWNKLGLDAPTMVIMIKGSVPPVVAIAMYQADAVATHFRTLGYLIAIISVLSLAILPRAKFLQNLLLSLIGTCIGAGIAELGIWTSLQARFNTTANPREYNQSQNVVCAIWLTASIWIANTLRAKFPAVQLPVIIFSILTNVAFTFGPQFRTVEQCSNLIVELLEAFMVAFALATATNLIIIPITCRTVVFKECTAYLKAMTGVIKSQRAYLKSLEKIDALTGSKEVPSGESEPSKSNMEKDKIAVVCSSPESVALKAAITALTGLHGKLQADMIYAKREIAYGKLDANDLEHIYQLFRNILVPLIGMGTIQDVFDRIATETDYNAQAEFGIEGSGDEFHKIVGEREKKMWTEVMKELHEPFAVAGEAMELGLQHAGLLLELIPRDKKDASKNKTGPTADIEAKGDSIGPGDIGFADVLHRKMKEFYFTRRETLRTWSEHKGLSTADFDASIPRPEDVIEASPADVQHTRDQQQLYLILYMEHLLYAAGKSIETLLRFAEQKVEDGTMKKKKLILPGFHRLRKWVTSIHIEDATVNADLPDSMESGTDTIYLGSGFNHRRDPEHLPPTTTWEHVGNFIREIPHFLGSEESAFGVRAALATMTVAIIGFLENTQQFFNEQRLVWAMIIIAIGMNPTSGQAIFGFLGRCAGTFLAALSSLVIWYIVDGKTPGIIVFLFLFTMVGIYFLMKNPRLMVIFLLAITTQTLIIGYELQVQKIGIAVSESTGQRYYPIYELAWYRLATVVGGSFVSFIWTIFPYPLTDSAALRKRLGGTIYLLANYYSIVHTTIDTRIHVTVKAPNEEHARELEKARNKVFGKLLLLIPSLEDHLDWQKFELTLGGKFPREAYEGIVLRVSHILNYLTLMSYASQWKELEQELEEQSDHGDEWMSNMAQLLDSIAPTSHAITSILSLLSAAVTQGNALPPHLPIPKPFQLSRRLEQLDRHILDSTHVTEKGYAAFAVIQVCASLVIDDLTKLAAAIKDLVGESDFAFTVVSSGNSSTSDITESLGKGKKD